MWPLMKAFLMLVLSLNNAFYRVDVSHFKN